MGFPGGSVVKNLPAMQDDTGDAGSIPGSERSPGGGHSSPLQYSCLENPMDRGAWWATVHRIAKTWTQPTRLSTQACPSYLLESSHQIEPTLKVGASYMALVPEGGDLWKLLSMVCSLSHPPFSWNLTSQVVQVAKFNPWLGKIPWRRALRTTPVLSPWAFHGQRRLVGYSPRTRKELDMTEQHTHTHTHTHTHPHTMHACPWIVFLARFLRVEFLGSDGPFPFCTVSTSFNPKWQYFC